MNITEAKNLIREMENAISVVHIGGNAAAKRVKGYIGKNDYERFAMAYAVLFCDEYELGEADIPAVASLFEETLLSTGLYHTVTEWKRDFYPNADVVWYEPPTENEYGEEVNSVELSDGWYAVI